MGYCALGGEHRQVVPEAPVRLVPHDVVEMHGIDAGEVRGGCVDQPLQPRKARDILANSG
jgi:hypothetical protein